MKWILDRLRRVVFFIVTYVPILFLLCLVSLFVRIFKKIGVLNPAFDVGMGPEPMINNVYHKRALEKFGWKAETFVSHQYFITGEFDYSTAHSGWPMRITSYCLFVRAMFRYRMLYLYFNGGPLAWTDHYRLEAFFLKVAGVKTLLMPYGGDIYDLSKCPNLIFKNAFMRSYPRFQRERRTRIRWQIDYWSHHANHILSGCDWVDYMWRWETLIPAHFAVDTNKLQLTKLPAAKTLRVLHAPNHREIKGTSAVIETIRALKASGADIELVLIEGVPNEQILKAISECHVVIDQLVIGWHGMFAVEAMALGRPVICCLREDLIELYSNSGDLRFDRSELPFIRSTGPELRTVLEKLLRDRSQLEVIASAGKTYVDRMHSLQAIGSVFDRINAVVLGKRP